MKIETLVPALRRQLRTCLTYGQTLVKGYPFRYGRSQRLDQAQQYPHCWSEFETVIPHRPGADEANANRLWNLQQAARHIDGLVLEPGQLFGFWNRIPKPTRGNGFRAGPAFKRGQVTTDMGGGLCLISTNLFNVLLLAGCEILERHSHSMDPYGDRRFFPLGRDAMVYHGYRDLIVRNTSTAAVQLRLAVLPETGLVLAQLWGEHLCPVAVRLESAILDSLPNPDPGQMPGYRTRLQRWTRPQANGGEFADWAEPLPGWRLDYTALSCYRPCAAYYGVGHTAIFNRP